MKLNDNKPLIILGDTNQGKTNLLFYLAREATRDNNKKKYILGYPKVYNGFLPINNLEDLSNINDCIVCIDELSRYFPPWDKKTNQKLMETLQFAEHNNIKIIASTQISQMVTRQLEAFIGQWAIKKIRMHTLKNGSTPKNILKHLIKHPNITSDYVKLRVNEFVWYNETGVVGENGVKNFPYQQVGKDWVQNTPTITPTKDLQKY
jgi:hypothetical protein